MLKKIWKGSLRMRTRYLFKRVSFAFALHARNVTISTNPGKKKFTGPKTGATIRSKLNMHCKKKYV